MKIKYDLKINDGGKNKEWSMAKNILGNFKIFTSVLLNY